MNKWVYEPLGVKNWDGCKPSNIIIRTPFYINISAHPIKSIVISSLNMSIFSCRVLLVLVVSVCLFLSEKANTHIVCRFAIRLIFLHGAIRCLKALFQSMSSIITPLGHVTIFGYLVIMVKRRCLSCSVKRIIYCLRKCVRVTLNGSSNVGSSLKA